MTDRIGEADLVLPALYVMNIKGGSCTTSELIRDLRTIMKPVGKDTEILRRRSDDKFSQIVRNLKAHDAFEKRRGLAVYRAGKTGGYFEITDWGKTYLEANREILDYLIANGFDYSENIKTLREIKKNNKRRIEIFDENIGIHEGQRITKQTALYERSSRLRSYAIKYYSSSGRIVCHACSFDFEAFYGPILGKGFIEIHHVKPIYKYKDEDLEITLADAVKNVAPLCSNCHRMVHRERKEPLGIDLLIEQVRQHGVFVGTRTT